MSESVLSIANAARRWPAAPALLHGDRILSFGALAEMVAPRVSRLVDAGASAPGLVLGLRPRLELDSLLWIYAALQLEQTLVLFHPRLAELELSRAQASVPGLVDLDSRELKLRDARRLPEALGSEVSAEERALALFFTSGTSGTPKLAVLSRRAFEASAAMSASRLGWKAHDRWLLSLPLAHVAGFSVITRCLLAGKPFVLPSVPSPFSPATFLAELERAQCTMVSIVPSLLEQLVETSSHVPPSLRVVLVGGAPAKPATVERAAKLGWPIVCTYGLTEACSSVSTTELTGPAEVGSGVGRPLAGIELRIREGQIQLRGPSLFSGYLGPEGIVSALDAEGWFDTGDLGRLDEAGVLQVDARRTDLILSGGENVYPREVELALEAQPGVLEALVVGVPDERWGERPVALLRVDSSFDEARAREGLDRQLARFKQPKAFLLVEHLPRTALGKLDRARGRMLVQPPEP